MIFHKHVMAAYQSRRSSNIYDEDILVQKASLGSKPCRVYETICTGNSLNKEKDMFRLNTPVTRLVINFYRKKWLKQAGAELCQAHTSLS